jgi:Protein of unknown function (DUF3592)
MMGGDTRFWFFFGGIWLLCGVGFLASSLGGLLFVDPAALDQPALLWLFLAAGIAISAVGGFIIHRAWTIAVRDRRLMQSGVERAATVLDIRRSAIDINRQARWHIVYRYEYGTGQPLQGESRALPGDAVADFKPGDRVRIKVDPQRPEQSLFLGGA